MQPCRWRRLSRIFGDDAGTKPCPALYALLLPMAVGLILRFSLGWDLDVTQDSDFAGNLSSALDVSRGDFTSMLFLGPRSLALGLGFFLFGGHGYRALFLVNTLLLYPLGATALWLLSRQALTSGRALFVPQLLFAVWPPFVFSSFLAATENILPLAMCLPLWGLVRSLKARTTASATVGGVALGLSLLLKPVLLGLGCLFPLAYFLRRTDEPPFCAARTTAKGKSLVLAGIYLLVAMATVAPWQVYSYAHLGFFEPISPFANHMLSCVNTPYGKRNYEVASGFAQNLMPELAQATTLKEVNAANKAYAREFFKHWPLFFVGQLPENLSVLCLPLNEMAVWVHANLPGGLAGYRGVAKGLDQGLIVFGLLLGIGGFFCFANRQGLVAKSLMRLVLVYGFVSTLVLLLGNIRHRMAYEPYLFILGASWLEAFEGGFRKGAAAPFHGAAFLAGRLYESLRWWGLLVWRRRILASVLALALGAAWAFAHDRTLRVGPGDLVAGTARRIDADYLATPHAVVGLALPGPGEWRAEFSLRAPSAGLYRLKAVYSAAASYPLDVLVNGERQLSGVFQESFGGAANAFARNRDIGLVRLQAGANTLSLVQAGPWTLPLPQPLAVARLAAPAPGGQVTEANDGEWTRLGPSGTFELQSGVVDVAVPAGTGLILRLGADKRGEVDLLFSCTLYPGEASGRSPETQSVHFSSLVQAMFLKPDFDVAALSVAVSARGTGQVFVDRQVRIEPGLDRDVLDRPGRLFMGPYIESLEFIFAR